MVYYKPVRTSITWKLLKWCRKNFSRGRHTTTIYDRFAIALYQIYQGLGWKSDFRNDSQYESYAASIVHFMGIGEMMQLHLEDHLPQDLKTFVAVDDSNTNLLYHISRAQQMVFYYKRVNNTRRGKSRYNPKQLEKDLATVIQILCCRIPGAKMPAAFELAMKIMTGVL